MKPVARLTAIATIFPTSTARSIHRLIEAERSITVVS